MIKITNLNKYYNKGTRNENHIINDFSYTFNDQGLYVLFGPSGSGKTTLLNVIGALDNYDSGEIVFEDRTFTKYIPRKADDLRNEMIGFIFQNYNLIDSMNVTENIEIVLDMIGITDKEEKKKRINDCLSAVGLYKHRKRSVLALSGGERQRVAIARALAKNPKVILADEPTGNLDSNNTFEVMNIIKRISQERLVILVSHEKDLVDFYADQIIEIKDGMMVSDYKNSVSSELKHKDTRNIYLKDYQNELKEIDNIKFNTYTDGTDKDLTFDVIYKNNEIYIKAKSTGKIHYIDNNSEIKLLDASEKEFHKKQAEFKSDFSFESFDNALNDTKKKKGFTSIFKSIKNGFKEQSFIKHSRFASRALVIAAVIFAFMITNLSAIFDFKESDYVFAPSNVVEVQMTLKDETNNKTFEEIYNLSLNDDRIESLQEGGTYISANFSKFYQSSTFGFSSVNNTFLTKKTPSLNYKVSVGSDLKEKYDVLISNFVADILIDSNGAKSNGIIEYEDLIGEEININKTYYYDYYTNDIKKYRIVGIINDKSKAVVLSSEDFSELVDSTKFNSYSGSCYIQTSDKEAIKEIVEGLGYSNVTYSQENARSSFISQRISDQSTRIISLSIMTIGITIYLILLIRSSMFQKIKEIGIMRSVGARRGDMVSIFSGEMFAITTKTSIIGFSIAYLIILYYNTRFSLDGFGFNIVSTGLITYLIGIIGIYFINIISSIIPILFLMRKTPVEIIKKYDI